MNFIKTFIQKLFSKKQNNNELYNAIMAAADRMEKHPEEYNFMRREVGVEGKQTCVLGHIGRQLGVDPRLSVSASSDRLGVEESVFYDRMGKCSDNHWHWKAGIAARGMRKYAEMYHS